MGTKVFTKKIFDKVERIGNTLPDPATIFALLSFLVVIISILAEHFSWSAIHPASGENIVAQTLFSKEKIQKFFLELPQIFAHFHPLAVVLVSMLGIGIADKSGLIHTSLKKVMKNIPAPLLTAFVAFVGIMSNLAVDAGYVVVIPLASLLYYSAGRHPLAGLAVGFASVSAGFSANLVLSSIDPLAGGITQEAAQILNKAYTVSVGANYYMMAAAVPVFILCTVLVNDFFIEKSLPPVNKNEVENLELSKALPNEKKALSYSLVSLAVILGLLAFFSIPEGSLFRDSKNTLTPLFNGIVAVMFFVFFIPGIIFSVVTKQVKNDRDAIKLMSSTMSDLSYYLVLVFFAAIFLALFKWSQLGAIFSIQGAELLKAINLTGYPLLILFMLLVGSVNILIGSLTAKWALMAPIFVPMMMSLGIDPEMTQAVYRMGDAFTNIISPIFVYLPLVIVFGQKYKKDFALGSVLRLMIPFSFAYGIAGAILIAIWHFFSIPLGF